MNVVNACNPCDHQDEREAAGLVKSEEPAGVDVKRLSGLSKLIADREAEQLKKEVEKIALPLFQLFANQSGSDREITFRTADYWSIKVIPDSKTPGSFLVKITVDSSLERRLVEKAVEIHTSRRVGAALNQFLERADSLCADVEQMRSEMPS